MTRSLKKVIAVIFDFDDTLVPDSTTALLAQHAVNLERFWKRDVRALMDAGYDSALAYLRGLLDRVGEGKPLGNLTAEDLRRFGSTLKLHAGLDRLFPDLVKIARKAGASVEFYVISGGLQEVIEGVPLLRKYASGIYASRLAGDSPRDPLRHVMRCVTFTEKTRFLFEINKGLRPVDTLKNPYLVNSHVPSSRRRVPFSNMIFVGDGLTDVPCLSLLEKEGGTAFGVFNPGDRSSAKRALLEFLGPRRVMSMHAPKYGPKDELGALLRGAVEHLADDRRIRSR